MADSVVLPQPRTIPLFQRIAALIPGVLLLAAVGYAGKWIEQFIARDGKAHHLVLPNIEYVLWAIVIGLLIANVIGIPKVFQPGVATYEFWLKSGIVLLGARFLVGDLLRLGGISLGLVLIEIVLSLAFMTLLGHLFKLRPKLTTLLAVGSSIYGVSDIIATQGAIDAHEEDSSYAIGAILAVGAISLFLFALIGHGLHLSDRGYGLWAGLAVDNTAEASAAGALFSDAAGNVAVLAETCRNAMIGFVVLGYAIYWAGKGQAVRVNNKQQSSFLVEQVSQVCLRLSVGFGLASGAFFTKPQIAAIGNLSRWAFLLTFAGVGLRTNLRDLAKQGARPFLVGAIGEIAIASLTLGLIYGATRIFQLLKRKCDQFVMISIEKHPSPMGTAGEVVNAQVCKNCIRGVESRPVPHMRFLGTH